MPLNQLRTTAFLRRVCSLTALGVISALSAKAQLAVTPAAGAANPSLFALDSTRPMDLATLAGVDYSSSSSSVDTSALAANPDSLNFSAAEGGMQPPPRRRYGSPRYNDKSHNADGSSKFTFEGAVGLTIPLANTYHYFDTSYAFGVGAGRQFSKKFAVMAKFDWDHFGINGTTLTNQSTIYNFGCPPGSVDAGACGVPVVDGNAHIWSFSLNPIYHVASGDKLGAYLVAGVGFYHKVTNFTTPQTGCYYDYFGDCYPVTENSTFDHYTSNAPGFSGGFGLDYKFSRFADERFFIEGRYVFINNSQRTGYTAASVASTNYNGNDYFPANSNRTTYIPIKVGIRF